MKTLEVDTQFHSSGIQGQTAYKVSSNAKMMKLLSDNLYSDKILAVIRELSTNALDSHVMAGRKHTAFDVNLPTYGIPVFSIRDYGTGMTREQLESMYTTYGASDKNQTNELQGCMGLGSKSPFAYANLFTTISYHNGMKHTYINCKDDKELPQLNFIKSEPTKEENGLEISMAVNKNDVSQFADKASRIYQDFPSAPTIKGNSTGYRAKKNTFSHVSKDTTWRLIDSGNSYEYQSYAIMGYVRYPIMASEFKTDVDRDNSRTTKTGKVETLVPWYQHGEGYNQQNTVIELLNLGFELDFDIGEIEMDISREGLQYTSITKDAIIDKMKNIVDELKEWTESKFINCKNLWDARCLYVALAAGDFRKIASLASLIQTKWDGKDLKKNADVKGLNVMRFHKDKGWRYNSSANVRRDNSVAYITARKNISVYVNDMKSGSYVSCIREIEAGKIDNNEIYLIQLDEVDDFITATGMDISTLTLCSTVPKPAKKKRTADTKMFVFEQSGNFNSNCTYWKKEEVDLNDGGYYVSIANWLIDDPKVNQPRNLHTLCKGLAQAGITVPDVHGIKRGVIDKVKKNKKWSCFIEWATKQYAAYMKKNTLDVLVSSITDYDNLSDSLKSLANNLKMTKNSTLMGKLSDTSPLKLWTKRVSDSKDNWQKNKTKMRALVLTANLLGYSVDDADNDWDETLAGEWENTVLKLYPMISCIDSYYSLGNDSKVLTKIVDYVCLIDSK
jgi:hypothetical protein